MEERERRDLLLRVVDHLGETHRAWVEGEDAGITPDFELSIEETCEVFSEGGIPGDCRKLERAVAEFREQWHLAKQAVGGGNMSAVAALPVDDFWKRLQYVIDCREAARPRPNFSVESIAELTAQKVPPAQICKIYGWIDGSGRPELHKLREELANPGTHTKDWVNPNERRRQDQERKEREALTRLRARAAAKIRRMTEPAPEPIGELIRQGVSANQIAKMKRLSIEEVFAAADALGVDPPVVDYEPVANARAPQEPEILPEQAAAMAAWSREGRPSAPMVDDDEPEAVAEGLGGALSVEQEIIEFASQGYEAKEIAAMMQAADVSVAKVKAVLKRLKEDPAAFATG